MTKHRRNERHTKKLVHAVLDAVCTVYNVKPEDVTSGKRGVAVDARHSLCYLLRKAYGLPVSVIQEIANISASTVRSSIATVEKFKGVTILGDQNDKVIK